MSSIIITPSEMNDYYAFSKYNIEIPYSSITASYERTVRYGGQDDWYDDVAEYDTQIFFDYNEIEGLSQFIDTTINQNTTNTITIKIISTNPQTYDSSIDILKYGIIRGATYGVEYDSDVKLEVENGLDIPIYFDGSKSPDNVYLEIIDNNNGNVIFSGTNDSVKEFFSAFEYPWAAPDVVPSTDINTLYYSINKVQLGFCAYSSNSNSPILNASGAIYKTSVDNTYESLVYELPIRLQEDSGGYYDYTLDLNDYKFSEGDIVTAYVIYSTYDNLFSTETYTFEVKNVIKVFCKVNNDLKVGMLYCRPSFEEEFKPGTELYQKDNNQYLKRIDTK